MAIDSYANLQSSVASWLHRTDLTTTIPDFIKLAETRINRELRVREAELEVTLTATPGLRFIDLPSDFSTPVSLYLTTYNPRFELTQTLAKQLAVSTTPGRPSFWAIDGLDMAFERPCDAAYTFQFRYNKNYTLSDVVTTNEILRNHPDVYLFGSLVEAASYTFDDRVQVWEGKFRTALESAKNQEVDSYNTSQLRTDDMGTRARRFNIYTGY